MGNAICPHSSLLSKCEEIRLKKEFKLDTGSKTRTRTSKACAEEVRVLVGLLLTYFLC